MAVSFIGGGNRNTQRKPPTRCNRLFTTFYAVVIPLYIVVVSLYTLNLIYVMICTLKLCSRQIDIVVMVLCSNAFYSMVFIEGDDDKIVNVVIVNVMVMHVDKI